MTEFLFARTGFLSGVARTLDLGGMFDAYNLSPSEEIADARAILADWTAVGNDIWQAIETVAADQAEDSVEP